MSNGVFPTLNELAGVVPARKPKVSETWVQDLGRSSAVAASAPSGWIPPAVETISTTPVGSIESARQAAREEGFEQGFKQGFAQGLTAGTERGLAEGRLRGRDEAYAEVLAAEEQGFVEFRAALEDVVQRVVPAVESWRVEVERRAAELAMEAVRKLLAAELATDRDTGMAIVRDALGYVDQPSVKIRLSPFDRAALAERKNELMAASAGLQNIEFVDDPSIEHGCVIETDSGTVDARLSTRLQLLEETLEAA